MTCKKYTRTVLFLTLIDFSSLDESNIYTDLLSEFVKNGDRIYAISPTERKKKVVTHLIENDECTILKLQIGNTQKNNVIEKGFSIITLESKFVQGISYYFKNIKFDWVLYSTPPITLQKAVKYVKNRDNAKTYLLLKDIFPQNAVDMGIMSSKGVRGILYRYFRRKEELLYEISDYIGCMSNANVEYVLNNNPKVLKEKIEICPNSIKAKEQRIAYIDKLKIRKKYDIPQNKIVFLYGGNLGKPQGLDFLTQCISKCEDESIYFLIVGSGTEYKKIKNYFDVNEPKNAKLMSGLSKIQYDKLVLACDVGLIFLSPQFTIPNFPSRILSYMQAEKPVLAATDLNTDLGKVVETGGFGYWCENGDYKSFFRYCSLLKEENKRRIMGKKAKEYLEEYFTVEKGYQIIRSHF